MANLVPEHERGLGQWQAQWLTLRSLVCATASGVAAMAEALERLEVRTDTMAANLERTQGLVFSEAVSVRLAQALGKSAAHTLTENSAPAPWREEALARSSARRRRRCKDYSGGRAERCSTRSAPSARRSR